jgi:hypothetical protein
MPDYATFFAGRYISANVVEGLGPRPLKIAKVVSEEVEQIDDPSQTRERMIVYFDGSRRGWLVNRTNAECLVAMFGRRTEDWIGRRVVLKSEPVRVGPTTQPGIRVHGSPDIAEDVRFSLRLPRKRPQPYTLKKTEDPG